MILPEFLLRLLIGVLVFFIGEKVIGLIENGDAKKLLGIVLVVAVVLYVIFGSIFPIH
jgi:hypothetical protein